MFSCQFNIHFRFRGFCGLKPAASLGLAVFLPALTLFAAGPVVWENAVVINTTSNFVDGGRDARGINPGRFGSQYGRLAKLADGSWLAVFTIYDNKGYKYGDAHGLTWQGTALQVARSTDNCRTWTLISTLRDNNRDLDNGELIQLPDGQLRLAPRPLSPKKR